MEDTRWTIPARIETERVTVRRYVETDAAAFHEVTTANVEFLRPWMWWIRLEPQTLAERVDTFNYFSAQSDSGEGYTFGMFAKDGAYLGGAGFNVMDGELEIGYWIREDAQGRGLVTEVAAALARVALVFAGAPRVTLAIEPSNASSLAVATRLGFAERGSRVEAFGPAGEPREHLLLEVTRESFPATAAARFPQPSLHDAGGESLPWPA